MIRYILGISIPMCHQSELPGSRTRSAARSKAAGIKEDRTLDRSL